MNKDDSILILGAKGLVGSALVRELKKSEYNNILTPDISELDLTVQQDVLNYFAKHKPRHLVLAAAKVGGIKANNLYRADFIWQNLSIETNVFQAAFESNVEKFLFLGSTCIYPENCPQPIKEEYLLTGPLETTNEPYAIAKIAGLKLAESFKRQHGKNFFSVMPTNLYGKNDNYHPENSHVIPGMIQRMKKVIDKNQKTFEVWGTGNPKREFLYVDDLAKACIFLLNHEGELPYHINIGTGTDISIKELAQIISKLMGFKGEIVFNTSIPDGTPQKLTDISRIKTLGWTPKITLEEGLKKTINFYLENITRK